MNLIPENTKKLSILASGGIDSTLLLYLIAKQIHEQKLDVIVHTISWNLHADRLIRLDEIVSLIRKRYPISVAPHTNFQRRSILIREAVESALLVNNSDYVFTGCNKVITDQFTPTRYIPGDTPPFRGDPLNNQHIRPFIEMDKIAIVRKYIELDIIDILKMTFSCGIYNYDLTYKECGECYFCQEKIWATKFLKIDDIFNYAVYK